MQPLPPLKDPGRRDPAERSRIDSSEREPRPTRRGVGRRPLISMLQETLTALLVVAFLASPSLAVEVKYQPSGYGRARFGMSPEEVAKLFKGKVRTLGDESMGATPVLGPNVVRQLLSDQKVPGLDLATTVELRYWKGKLWVAIVYYGQNSAEQVNQSLLKRLGPPTLASSDIVWHFPKVMVNTANREHWYAIGDTALSSQAQAALLEELRRQQQMQAPPPAPAAVPTPAGK